MEKTLARIPNGAGEVRIRVSEFKGRTYLDIRKWYLDKENASAEDQGANAESAYKPTPKGIALPPALARKVIDALLKISEEGALPEVEEGGEVE